MKRRSHPDRRVLQDIVRRVVRASQPEKIILFGSAARGDMHADSDFDLLVVKSGRFNRGKLADSVYTSLIGAGAAVDVVFASPQDIEKFRHDDCTIVARALVDGVVVYGA